MNLPSCRLQLVLKEEKLKKKSTSTTKFEDLPNEILVKIFSYLHFKSLGRCAQLSHRFKNVAQTPVLWETVVEKNKEIPAGFVKLAIQLGCKHLHLEGSCITVNNDSDYVIHKLPKHNHVKTLNLREFEETCDDSTRLMIACRNVEKLSLSAMNFTTGRYIPSIVRNASTLKVLDLSNCWDIGYKQVKRIFTACQELKEVDLSCCCIGTRHKKLTEESIEFIVENVPTSLERLNLSGQAVENHHLSMLLDRCKELKELSLCKTLISQHYWNTLPDAITEVVKCKVEKYV